MAERVIIVPYDPNWQELFLQLAKPMRTALGKTALRIDHIGSTAVPGLDAKPIIDIQISVAMLGPLGIVETAPLQASHAASLQVLDIFNTFRIPLENLGYIFRSDNPDRTKRYFREAPGQRCTHIHVRQAGSWSEQLALLFRDYLRTHSDDAQRYAQRKYQLAEQYGEDRHGYTEAKSDIIWEIIRKAHRWSQDTGWQPEKSDL
jgi:GrpB-like predicted nucleotidyltransferase (UPF0157 family)